MKLRNAFGIALVASGVVASTTLADSIHGVFDNVGANRIYSLPLIGGGSYYVGALNHTWSGGTGAAAAYDGTFGTFCIDEQSVSTQSHVFNLVNITSAPVSTAGNAGNPGHSYTNVQAHRLDAVARAALADGYLDSRGGFVGSNNDCAAAIQLLVWDSVWEPDSAGSTWNITNGTFHVSASSAVKSIFDNLAAAANALYNINGGLMVRSLSSDGGQDQLVLAASSPVLVPLPPAALAGSSMLAGVAGFGYVRRRRNGIA